MKKRHHQDINETFELDSPSPFLYDISVSIDIPHENITYINDIPAEELRGTSTPRSSSDTLTVDQYFHTDNSSPAWGLDNASSTLTAEFGHVRTPNAVQELSLSSDHLFTPVRTILLTSDDPFMGATGNESLDSLLPRGEEIDAGAIAETAKKLCLANDGDASTTKLSLGRGIGSNSAATNTDDSAFVFPEQPAQPVDLSFKTQSRISPKSSQSDKGKIDPDTTKEDLNNTNDSEEFDLNACIESETRTLIETSSETRKLIHHVLMVLSNGPEDSQPTSREHYQKPQGPSCFAGQYLCCECAPLPGEQVDSYRMETELDCSKGIDQWSHRPLFCTFCDSGPQSMDQRYFWFNEDISWSDGYGNTSLHVAAVLGACPTILVQVIRHGVDVNRTNTAGQNFLHAFQPERHLFACKGYRLLVNELRNRGFDFEHRDAWHRTIHDVLQPKGTAELWDALTREVRINPVDLRESLIDHIYGLDGPSSIDTAKKLLHEGADINQRDFLGQAPLHASITNGQTSITRALLLLQPNLHARDNEGKGVLAAGQDALRRAKSDASMYAKITACMTLAIDAGAIAEPTSHDEWRLPNYQHWPGDPTQPKETSQESCADIQN